MQKFTVGFALVLFAPLWLAAQSATTIWVPYHAEPLDQQLRLVKTGTAVSWPVSGRQIAFRTFDRMAVRDEHPIRYVVLASSPLTIQLPYDAMESWDRSIEPTGRFGYEFTHKFYGSARAGITAVRNSSFLPDLDIPNWNAYLGSLGDAPNARLITNDDSAINNRMIRILGGRTRILEYRFSGEEPDDPVRSVVQIFTDLRNGPLVIFSLECETQLLPEIGPDFQVLVESFDFPIEN
jgi:hypothetical protein